MKTTVLVRGVGDVGSAVAHLLFRNGHGVVGHDSPAPATHRRGMAFADAMFDGGSALEGVQAQRIDDVNELLRALWLGGAIPVTALPFDQVLAANRWDAVVDARMRKRAKPEDQRAFAPLVIGLGPNFIAGRRGNVHVAVETSWDHLGAVIRDGPTLPLAGEPRPIAGVGRERCVYAPCEGRFGSSRVIGDLVQAGDAVAWIGDVGLNAPLGGTIRGLTRNGVSVPKGAKVIEIDPRGESASVRTLGERPRIIAEAVAAIVADIPLGRALRAI
jgi:xanthine dehydrogenase accessory factor